MIKGGGPYLGIEIGGTKLQVCVGDGAGHIRERRSFSVDPAAGADGIRSQLQETIAELSGRIKPRAVGVGFGGPVEWQTGRICCSHQIAGWSDFPLAAWLSGLAGAPVRADNDANTAALGEALLGVGTGFKIVFYVTLGSGVGGGLVHGGGIYHGAAPGEAEMGHVRLDKTGVIVEERCSGWAVNKKIRQAVKRHPRGALARCVGSSVSHEARCLGPALKARDPDARKILKEVADDLAFGLSHVVHLFHPEIIVLGGGLALVGEPLRKAVQAALRKYVMDAFVPGPKVALSRLREDAVPVGALCLAARQVASSSRR